MVCCGIVHKPLPLTYFRLDLGLTESEAQINFSRRYFLSFLGSSHHPDAFSSVNFSHLFGFNFIFDTVKVG